MTTTPVRALAQEHGLPAPGPADVPANVHSLAAARAEREVPPTVLHALTTLRTRYAEPITLEVLAGEVYVSPFHFSRVFAKATGTTPGRYLTAVRLFEAKRLLMTTSETVADIVCAVGYSSVGTFTSRFTKAVGMTPTQYRDPRVRELLLAVAPHFQHLPRPDDLRAAAARGAAAGQRGGATVAVRVVADAGVHPVDVLVGAFDGPIPQRGPVAFAGAYGTGSTTVTLDGVPDGRWSLLAAAGYRAPDGSAGLLVGSVRAPLAVRAGDEARVRLRLRPLRPADPPIAITFAETAGRPVTPSTALRAS